MSERDSKENEQKHKYYGILVFSIALLVLKVVLCITFVFLEFKGKGLTIKVVFSFLCLLASFYIDYAYGSLSEKINGTKNDKTSEKFISVLMCACLICFILTSIMLSQTALVTDEKKEQTHIDYETYEEPVTECYITNTGECYHAEDCGYLHSKIKTTVASAKARGYEPCSACWHSTITHRREISSTEVTYEKKHHYILSYFISLATWLLICILVNLLYLKIKKKKTS